MSKNEISMKRKGQKLMGNCVSSELPPLDLKDLERQLRQRHEELKDTIERIEKSQYVPQELLDLEVSV